MLITQSIDNLLNGVSQAQPQQRDSSQAEELVNGLSHPARGLRKRPPTEYVAKLTSLPFGWDSAFIYPILRDATHRYNMAVVNGDLQVFDAVTGAAQTVYFPQGKAYLSTTDLFRAVSTGDLTFLLNRSVTARKDVTQKSTATVYEALLVVRQADYQTAYTATLNGITVTYTTPAATTPDVRAQIGTDVVAANLLKQLLIDPILGVEFLYTQYGSSLYLTRADGKDFTLSVKDGLGDVALLAIKGAVQAFDKLPTTAKLGMIVEVTGDPESTVDNYFVQFAGNGVWKEVIGPGLLTSFDPLTLPHQLTFGGPILKDTPNATLPILPRVIENDSANYWKQGWQGKNGGSGLNEDDSQLTYFHNDYFTTVINGTDGSPRTFTVMFDINASSLSPADNVIVTLYAETAAGSGAYANLSSAMFGGGTNAPNNTLQAINWGLPAGAKLKVALTYTSGATPAAPNVAYLTLHGKYLAQKQSIRLNDNTPLNAGITTQDGLGTTFTFDATTMYPAGFGIQATVDTTHVYTYTPGADQNGAAVATGLAGAINGASFTAIILKPGVVFVTKATGIAPLGSVATTWNPATMFWSPTLGVVTSAYVGVTLLNLTDGSSGTITANTGTTITVPLSGGAANAFHPGDVVRVVGSGTYFVFTPAPWEARAAGDDITCPFPSFVDNTLDEIFVYQGRLGVTSRENVCLSEAGEFNNFFRLTATDLLDDDAIDIRSSTKTIPQFFGVVPWLDGAYALTDQNLMRVSGEPVLTPKTVRLDPMGDYPSAANVRPVVSDRHLFIAGEKNGYARVAVASRLPVTIATEGAVSVRDVTTHVPTYLVGNPLQIVLDAQAGLLFVLTDGGSQRSLYVLSYALGNVADESGQRLAWSRWDFAPTSFVLSMDVINGVLSLIIKRADGVYMESLTLDPIEVLPTGVLIGDGTGAGDGTYDGTGVLV